MAGVSSLLRSATSAQKTIRAAQDAQVAFDWENSAQTYNDYVQYSKFLSDQAGKTTSSTDALSYATKARGALRSYTSNEIQRASQKVQEGGGTLLDKMGTIKDLYDQAVANGDGNLAQNLLSQWDSTSVQYQNETIAKAQAGQALAGQMATLRSNSVLDAVDTIKNYTGELSGLFKSAGQDKFNEQIKSYAKELGLNENAGFFDVYTNLADQAVSILDNAIASEADPSNMQKFQKERNNLLTGDVFSLPSTGGKDIKISYQDLKDQADANRVGEEVFQQTQTGQGTVFTRNKNTGFVWGRDETGNYRQIQTYAPNINYTSQVKNGKKDQLTGKDQFYNYKDLLKNAGIQYSEADGKIMIKNTGNIPGFYGSPFPTGQNIEVTVGPDGQLQITNGQDAYNLGFDNKGKFTGLQKYEPSAITQVNGAPGENGYFKGDARFNQRFLATQDLSRFAPDINSLVGIVDQNQMEKYRSTIKNFGLLHGVEGLGASPSSVLQTNVNFSTLQNAASSVIQPRPVVTQAAPTPGLQGSAINPFNLPAVPHLAVKPLPPQVINSVGNANPGRITGVSNAQPTSGLNLQVR